MIFAEQKISSGCNCENVSHCEKKSLRIQNSSIIIVNFLREAKEKFLRGEFYVISGLNLLAILLSGVDRVKGKLGWKLHLAMRFEPPLMSK